MKSLLRIDVRENRISDFPDVGENPTVPITDLYLGFNSILKFPSSKGFYKLPNLVTLDLQNNRFFLLSFFLLSYSISEVPVELADLKTLTSLDLRSNTLKHLPGEIGFMNLQKLLIEGTIGWLMDSPFKEMCFVVFQGKQ